MTWSDEKVSTGRCYKVIPPKKNRFDTMCKMIELDNERSAALLIMV